MTAKAGGLKEADFQDQVTQLAVMLGWSWMHVRKAMTPGTYLTPTSGPLAKWPDLFLAHPEKRRMLLVELKRDNVAVEEPQLAVLRTLERAAPPGVEVHVWRPRDWDYLQEVLR